MSNPNDIWNSILSMNVEQPKINEPTPPTANVLQPTPQPTIVDPLAALNSLVIPVNVTPIIAQPTATVIEEPDEDEEELYEDEEKIETNINLGSFNLDGPVSRQAPQPANQSFTFDLGLSNTNTEQPVKRGRGRPPKAGTAQDLITLLPNSLATEDDKSTNIVANAEVLSQTRRSTTEVNTSIPKKAFTALANSLQGIVDTMRELGKE